MNYKFKTKPYAHQLKALEMSWEKKAFAYFMEMGTGKSKVLIDNVAMHMPADGSVWVTNNTKYHNAFNGGEENRIHLVACVLDYKFN